ncbi:N-formylglutamate amidohydrolase [Olivibacter sp. XZL3]|uniref:N-formylglutamate amidohydrolase n=1 Tax=Olivibacter sp. XZL3 TaxID=1735116 RepID=UPI001066E6F4|nr:N-formylglutamate amidohydrolase [Olivibacter sp. XZL3]
MESQTYIDSVNSPVIATAIHDGHHIPPVFRDKMLLLEHERMREEDPYTADMINLPVNKIIAGNSRFVADLNRPKDRCIYRTPDDAWGLTVWATKLTADEEQEINTYYDGFYLKAEALLESVIDRYGCFVVLDIHTYNHRRQDAYTASPVEQNPEINIGTANNDPKWRPLIDAFIGGLSKSVINGHLPDVRENIKFKGGAFSHWICSRYGSYGCVLSVEFKKTFMDEWTGRVNINHLMDIQQALRDNLPLLKNGLLQLSQNEKTIK